LIARSPRHGLLFQRGRSVARGRRGKTLARGEGCVVNLTSSMNGVVLRGYRWIARYDSFYMAFWHLRALLAAETAAWCSLKNPADCGP